MLSQKYNIERKLCDIRRSSKSGGFCEERLEYFYTDSQPVQAERQAKKSKTDVTVMPKLASGGNSFKKVFFVALIAIFFAAGFAGLSFAFYSSKKAFVESESKSVSVSAYQNMRSALQYALDFDFEKAGFEIFEAKKKLSEVKKKNSGILAFAAGAFGNGEQADMQSIISNGLSIAEALRPLLEMSASSLFRQGYKGQAGEEKPAGEILSEVSARAINAAEVLASSGQRGDMTTDMKDDFEKLASYSAFFSEFLGTEKPRNFLVIFENSSELRSSGGFASSYSLISAEGGRITKIVTDDIFNLDGELSYQVVPPKPLQKISTAWSAHDANWFLDFPISAEKLAFFYEKASGVSIDGVIALNQNTLKKILRVTGPVQLNDFSFPLSEEYFLNIVKFRVDQNYKGENNKPKKILDDMIALIFERFATLSNKELGALLSVFSESMDARDMIFWSEDKKLNKVFAENGWNGEIKKDAGADYLAVAVNNMSGTDGDDTDFQKIGKTSEITADGFLMNTVQIKRTNNSDKEKLYYIKTYVPSGSEFLSTSGNLKADFGSPIDYKKSQFAIDPDVLESESEWKADEKTKTHVYQESGKTVFGNWVAIKPREEKEIVLQYKVPLSADDGVKFVFQRQPGVESMLDFNAILPSGFIAADSSQESFVGDFNKDLIFDLSFIK